jgi:hypothetical protein
LFYINKRTTNSLLTMDKTKIRKVRMKDQGNDFLFWQSQSFEKRLETIEELRNEYILWKYGAQQGFQRVYRIIKRK